MPDNCEGKIGEDKAVVDKFSFTTVEELGSLAQAPGILSISRP